MLFPLQSYLHTFLLHEFLTITTPSNPPTVLGFSEPTVLWLGGKEKEKKGKKKNSTPQPQN